MTIANLASMRLRHCELLQLADQSQASLDIVETILRDSPNVLQIQLRAVKAMEQIAMDAESVVGIRGAIFGPLDERGNRTDSPIWGWEKLTAHLQKLRFSPNATEQQTEQFLEVQYRLARCRWLLAGVTSDPAERDQLLNKTRKQLHVLLALAAKDNPNQRKWIDSLGQLQIVLGNEVLSLHDS